MGSLVLLGYRTAVFIHALFLECEVVLRIFRELAQCRKVRLTIQPLVEDSTKIFGPLEDRLMLLVYELDANGVFLAPLHTRLPITDSYVAFLSQQMTGVNAGKRVAHDVCYRVISSPSQPYLPNVSASLTRKSFGVSGLLYNNLIIYDRETDSNWSQMLGQSVNGNTDLDITVIYSRELSDGTILSFSP
jgi:hypothetical protein